MKNKQMLLLVLVSIALVFSLILSASVLNMAPVMAEDEVTPMVAAGGFFTVGLKSDRTVIAVGDNSYGQCNVGGWTDITQVAAGGAHTVGLKTDGTVVAVGADIELAKFLNLVRAKLNSPAELRVYDSEGRMTGVSDGEVQEEIQWATFNQEDESIMIQYGYDTYFYEVEGTGSGSYGLSVYTVDPEGKITFTATDIPTTSSAKHRYHIDWGALSEGEAGVTVQVDSDGDGTFERTFTSDGELTGDEFIPQSGCFIATAAYGTPMADEIQILRDFRDEYLLINSVGRTFVDFYYRVSPPIAEFITEHPVLKPIVRAGLVPAVVISIIAVSTTLAEKIAILGLVVLVSVALVVWATRRRGRGPEYS
jgi:hypothetical protein